MGAQTLLSMVISIHAPREGSDQEAWAETWGKEHFYPRSPRGERPAASVALTSTHGISIHAPREGSDSPTTVRRENSRPISIHAPREGSDESSTATSININISIHAPREGSDHAHRRGEAGC